MRFKLTISEYFIETRGRFRFSIQNTIKLPFHPQIGLTVLIADQFEIPIENLMWKHNEQKFVCFLTHRQEVDPAVNGREFVEFIERKMIHGWEMESAQSFVDFSDLKASVE